MPLHRPFLYGRQYGLPVSFQHISPFFCQPFPKSRCQSASEYSILCSSPNIFAVRYQQNLTKYSRTRATMKRGWESHVANARDDEEYEMLTRPATASAKALGDSDVKTITSVKYKQESYQSTARIIIWAICILTGLFLILTSTTLGSAIASNRKSSLNIQGIMPSIVIASGDCDSLKFANLSLHLFINCIGTIIIGASNYLQQSFPFLYATDIKFVQVLPLKTLRRRCKSMETYPLELIHRLPSFVDVSGP